MNKTISRLTLATFFLLAFADTSSRHAQLAASPENNSHHEYQVSIDNFSFTPATLAVPAGATVTWTNKDDIPHIVVGSEGNTLKSPVLDTDEKFTFAFPRAGTYPYFCAMHPKMTGKVVVQ